MRLLSHKGATKTPPPVPCAHDNYYFLILFRASAIAFCRQFILCRQFVLRSRFDVRYRCILCSRLSLLRRFNSCRRLNFSVAALLTPQIFCRRFFCRSFCRRRFFSACLICRLVLAVIMFPTASSYSPVCLACTGLKAYIIKGNFSQQVYLCSTALTFADNATFQSVCLATTDYFCGKLVFRRQRISQ